MQPVERTRITPALVVDGAAAALDFYAEVFGASERSRSSALDGSVARAEIEIGDDRLVVMDASPRMGTKAPPPGGLDGSPAFLFVHVPDVDAVMARAAELGADVRRPAQDQFYGERDGYLVDPFGHGWTIATRIEDVAPEELDRRMEALAAGRPWR